MNTKNVILCADDFGMSKNINKGILQLVQNNALQAVSCMTNYQDWPEGARALKQESNVQVGLHFNLKKPTLPIIIALSYAGLLKKTFILSELEKQYEAFLKHFEKEPDFIDGHQHIHQLPVIRNVLIDFYQKHCQGKKTWLRSTKNKQRHWKAIVINLLGGKTFNTLLKRNMIPHNPDFSGIYHFSHSKDYPSHLKTFIHEIDSNGLIMCHPGLEEGFRRDEYSALLNNK